MVRHDAGASEAERDPGTAVSIIVNQELGSVAAWNEFVVELKTDPALAVRPNANEIRVGRPQ
jgi:hypothetical protein